MFTRNNVLSENAKMPLCSLAIVAMVLLFTANVSAQSRPCSSGVCIGVNCIPPTPKCPEEISGGSTSLANCAQHYAEGFAWPEGELNSSVPTTAGRPAKGALLTSAYGACVFRATDHEQEPPVIFARNDYSRRQAFNADSTRFVAYANDGFWHLYDARTLAYLKRLNGPGGDAEIQWHPENPATAYYIETGGGLEIYEIDVEQNTNRTISRFSGRLPWSNVERLSTRAEGSPSADGRYWGLLALTENFNSLGLLTYDMLTDTIVATYDFADNNISVGPDHVSMSPSGEFLVASWVSQEPGTTAFSRDFSEQFQVLAGTSHSDIALLPNGNDAFVSLDYNSGGGDVFMVELQTRKRTVLFPTYLGGSVATAIHFSGKAYDTPGWVLVSTYGTQGAQSWFHDKLFAISLTDTPKILNIAHHHSIGSDYWLQPHASVNRDFTRVVFNSNWGDYTEGTDVDVYMVELPAGTIR